MFLNRSARICIGIIFLIGMACCSPKDDVTAIRKVIEEGAKFAEEHDIRGVLNFTTEDFIASPGSHDRQQVKGILFVTFRRYGQFSVMFPKPDVELSKGSNTAIATVPFFIVKKEKTLPDIKKLYNEPKRWLEEVGDDADLYRLKLDMIKFDGDWRVRKAELRPFGLTE